MSNIQVAILMGSKSDLDTMQETVKVLKDFGVPHEMKVLSAHRTPSETSAYAEKLVERKVKVVICGAGMSAALAGVVAAHSILPVIGIPMLNSAVQGMDALLSTVQMPPGVPVGAVAIGKAGAVNAALLAIRILALEDSSLGEKLESYKEKQRKEILETQL